MRPFFFGADTGKLEVAVEEALAGVAEAIVDGGGLGEVGSMQEEIDLGLELFGDAGGGTLEGLVGVNDEVVGGAGEEEPVGNGAGEGRGVATGGRTNNQPVIDAIFEGEECAGELHVGGAGGEGRGRELLSTLDGHGAVEKTNHRNGDFLLLGEAGGSSAGELPGAIVGLAGDGKEATGGRRGMRGIFNGCGLDRLLGSSLGGIAIFGADTLGLGTPPRLIHRARAFEKQLGYVGH